MYSIININLTPNGKQQPSHFPFLFIFFPINLLSYSTITRGEWIKSIWNHWKTNKAGVRKAKFWSGSVAGGKKINENSLETRSVPKYVVGYCWFPAWKSGKIEAGMGKRNGSIVMGLQQEFWGSELWNNQPWIPLWRSWTLWIGLVPRDWGGMLLISI